MPASNILCFQFVIQPLFVNSYTNAPGHVWDNGNVTRQAICSEDGEKICACSKTKTETIKASGHKLEDGICTKCGETPKV